MAMDSISARAALLQALITGEGYGLELAERVKEKTGGSVVLHQGTLYPTLRSMEKEGLVKSYEGPPIPERGGRPRVFYRITALGRRTAMEDTKAIGGLFGLAVPT
jgi:PadR family transcriptional regulator PadR